jgi:hypothetical protein
MRMNPFHPLLLYTSGIEGIVFHHPDGRMAKVKGRDFTATSPS